MVCPKKIEKLAVGTLHNRPTLELFCDLHVVVVVISRFFSTSEDRPRHGSFNLFCPAYIIFFLRVEAPKSCLVA